MSDEFITIPLERFKDLIRAETELDCLTHNGVDNWEWYGESMNGFEETYSDHPHNVLKGYYNIIDSILEEEVQKYKKETK
jgi:hypothetical protein